MLAASRAFNSAALSSSICASVANRFTVNKDNFLSRDRQEAVLYLQLSLTKTAIGLPVFPQHMRQRPMYLAGVNPVQITAGVRFDGTHHFLWPNRGFHYDMNMIRPDVRSDQAPAPEYTSLRQSLRNDLAPQFGANGIGFQQSAFRPDSSLCRGVP